MISTLVFDVETQKWVDDFDNVDWQGQKISIVCGYSSITGRHHVWDQHTLEDLGDAIVSHDAIMGFNSVNFDLPLIEGNIQAKGGNLDFKLLPSRHFDLLQWILDATEGSHGGYSLEECSKRTLGMGKGGDGSNAPQLWSQFRVAELIDYCIQDVHLTRNLFHHAQTHGSIINPNFVPLNLPIPDGFMDLKI